MKGLENYNRYLSQLDSYLCIVSEVEKELAAIKSSRDGEMASAKNALEEHEKSVELAARELELRFCQQSRQLARQKIEGVALPEKVRPFQTEQSFEELAEEQSKQYKYLFALLDEYKASIELEGLKETRLVYARARRNAVIKAQRIESLIEEVEENTDDGDQKGGETKTGCLNSLMSIVMVFSLLSLLLFR